MQRFVVERRDERVGILNVDLQFTVLAFDWELEEHCAPFCPCALNVRSRYAMIPVNGRRPDLRGHQERHCRSDPKLRIRNDDTREASLAAEATGIDELGGLASLVKYNAYGIEVGESGPPMAIEDGIPDASEEDETSYDQVQVLGQEFNHFGLLLLRASATSGNSAASARGRPQADHRARLLQLRVGGRSLRFTTVA